MATLSTKTLLEAVNELLLMAGERPVTSTTSSPVARKAAACLREAVLEIALLDDWAFTRERINALTWVNEKADLGEIQRLVSVKYGTPQKGFRQVVFIEPDDFDLRAIAPGEPTFWTVDGYGSVKLNPYPQMTDQRLSTVFDVIQGLIPPELDNSYFPVPDRFMPLVTKRSLYLFVLRHLDDAGLAAQYNNEFELMVQLFRNRERYRPRGSANMYGGRRRP